MDINFLSEYVVVLVLGICLCVGYILKHLITTDKINRWIPFIMGVLGIALNIWIQMEVTPVVVLGGLVSGLASTGLHQVFKQLINKEEA